RSAVLGSLGGRKERMNVKTAPHRSFGIWCSSSKMIFSSQFCLAMIHLLIWGRILPHLVGDLSRRILSQGKCAPLPDVSKQAGKVVLTPGAGWHAFAAPLPRGLWLNAGQGPRKHGTPFWQKILAYLLCRT